MEATLGQIVSACTYTKPLMSKKEHNMGTISIHAEEVAQSRHYLTIQFAGSHLDKKDMFGKSDPYLEFHRANKDKLL